MFQTVECLRRIERDKEALRHLRDIARLELRVNPKDFNAMVSEVLKSVTV